MSFNRISPVILVVICARTGHYLTTYYLPIYSFFNDITSRLTYTVSNNTDIDKWIKRKDFKRRGNTLFNHAILAFAFMG